MNLARRSPPIRRKQGPRHGMQNCGCGYAAPGHLYHRRGSIRPDVPTPVKRWEGVRIGTAALPGYASSSHGEVVTAPHKKRTSPETTEVAAIRALQKWAAVQIGRLVAFELGRCL